MLITKVFGDKFDDSWLEINYYESNDLLVFVAKNNGKTTNIVLHEDDIEAIKDLFLKINETKLKGGIKNEL